VLIDGQATRKNPGAPDAQPDLYDKQIIFFASSRGPYKVRCWAGFGPWALRDVDFITKEYMRGKVMIMW